MKKIFLLLSFLSAFVVHASSNLRDNVCIVKSSISEDGIDSYNWVGNWLDAAGAEGLANRLKSVEKGSFGSGFIVRFGNDEPVLITNYHVVINDDSVDLEFVNIDGESTEYKDCKVLYASGRSDLAIVELPKELKKRQGLKISRTTAIDGDEVWSAGYPGLINGGAWQLGRGTVTNQKTFVDELEVENVDYVIQHSAIIGSGNSGGPLLLRNKSRNFEVVGVNTWSFYGRDNTYFSVPSKFLQKFYDEYKKQKALSNKDSLTNSCNNFAALITSEDRSYPKSVDMFSKEFIYKYGGKSSVSLMKDYSDDELESYLGKLNNSPTRAMGLSIYKRIEEKYSSGNFKFNKIIDTDISEESQVATSFKLDDEEVEVLWAHQFGEWRLADISLHKAKSPSEQKKRNDEDKYLMIYSFFKIKGGLSTFSLSGEDAIEYNSSGQTILGIEGFRYFNRNLGYTFGYYYQKVSYDTSLVPSMSLHMCNVSLRLHFPKELDKKLAFPAIVPFASIGVSGGIGFESDMYADYERSTDDFLYTGYNISVGAEYIISEKFGLGLELMYSDYGDTTYSYYGYNSGYSDYTVDLSTFSAMLTLSLS